MGVPPPNVVATTTAAAATHLAMTPNTKSFLIGGLLAQRDQCLPY
jgi:hypothetical protein